MENTELLNKTLQPEFDLYSLLEISKEGVDEKQFFSQLYGHEFAPVSSADNQNTGISSESNVFSELGGTGDGNNQPVGGVQEEEFFSQLSAIDFATINSVDNQNSELTSESNVFSKLGCTADHNYRSADGAEEEFFSELYADDFSLITSADNQNSRITSESSVFSKPECTADSNRQSVDGVQDEEFFSQLSAIDFAIINSADNQNSGITSESNVFPKSGCTADGSKQSTGVIEGEFISQLYADDLAPITSADSQNTGITPESNVFSKPGYTADSDNQSPSNVSTGKLDARNETISSTSTFPDSVTPCCSFWQVPCLSSRALHDFKEALSLQNTKKQSEITQPVHFHNVEDNANGLPPTGAPHSNFPIRSAEGHSGSMFASALPTLEYAGNSFSGCIPGTGAKRTSVIETDVDCTNALTSEDSTPQSFIAGHPQTHHRVRKSRNLANKSEKKVIDKTSEEYRIMRAKNTIAKRRSRERARQRLLENDSIDFIELVTRIRSLRNNSTENVPSDVFFGQQSNPNCMTLTPTGETHLSQHACDCKKRAVTKLMNLQNIQSKVAALTASGRSMIGNLQINISKPQSDMTLPLALPMIQSEASSSSSYIPATGNEHRPSVESDIDGFNTASSEYNAPSTSTRSQLVAHDDCRNTHDFGMNTEKGSFDKISDECTVKLTRKISARRKHLQKARSNDTEYTRRFSNLSTKNEELRRRNTTLQEKVNYFEYLFDLGSSVAKEGTRNTNKENTVTKKQGPKSCQPSLDYKKSTSVFREQKSP